jgi:hypothetical protein
MWVSSTAVCIPLSPHTERNANHFLVKGVEELVYLFEPTTLAGGYLSIVIAILYFGSVYGMEKLGSSTLWKPWIRGLLADYSFAIPTFFWVGFYYFPGRLARTEIYRVPVVGAFQPTQDRNWVIDFWSLDVKWVFVALPFGFLMMLLFYYDHNVSSLTAQARQYPLNKPAGFHWDFFLLGCTCFVGGVIGLPLPNGLVPQAPVHTDSLTVYETRLKITETKDGGEIRKPEVEATAVVEQRVSHFLMGMAIWGTMTGPLLTVLHIIPAAIFAGVFFVVGVSSRCFARHATNTNTPLVGFDRVQRYSRQILVPQFGTTLHPARQSAQYRRTQEDMAFHWHSGFCCSMHCRHLSDHCRDRLSCPYHGAHSTSHVPHAEVVHRA